ncbi:MAG: Hsp20/alpha crystallin family protein [Romboutsia sp.]|uniref:Hsp20/alpha crystallin family protein n=1 Tax=Terrisporobacter sp. TaxID=1965305 RepID=UPI002FCC5F59
MKLVPMNNNNFGMSLFDSMFDDVFKDPFFSNRRPMEKVMKTDIQEKEGNHLLDMDLPGYDKEDIKAQLKDGYLTITAEKNTVNEDKDEKGNYIRRERYSGKCSRSLYVGENISEEDIKANFNNGILQLTFPKELPKKEEDMKYITID